MIDQQIVIDRVGMIEVGRVAIIQRHVLQIAIVQVLLDENDFVGMDGFENAIGDRRLPRTCAAADANYHSR